MKNILIIDDNESIREALQFALESQGHNVNTTANYNKHDIDESLDLIILDMLLSGHYGPDICQELKNDNHTSNIPVVMISAHPNAKESVRECGADGFLSKPFELDKLISIVDEYAT